MLAEPAGRRTRSSRSADATGSGRARSVSLVPEAQQRDLSGQAVRGWPGDATQGHLDGHRLVAVARSIAERLLGGMGTRWAHTRGVAERATVLAPAVAAEERPLLVAAAWVHDIGYAETVRRSGFHPLDGAGHLRDRGLSELLAGLVAHHSCARFTAVVHGLDRELAAFADPRCWTGPLADALTAADQTTGPDGDPMDVESRLADMLRRHGPDSPQARVHHLRAPVVRAAVTHTEHRLLAARLADAFL